MTREEILESARICVCGERPTDYGSPEDSFAAIADLWTVYINQTAELQDYLELTPVDVACMMALLKIARIAKGTGTADSFIDLAGYAACGGEIATRGRDAAV